MALAVGGRSDADMDLGAPRECDRRRLIENAAGNLQVAPDADAAAHAAPLRLPAPRRETLVVGGVERGREQRWKITAVIGRAGGGDVGNGVGADQVAAPQLGRIDPADARRLVHHAFEQVIGLRPAGAAIGAGRDRVGEHGAHVDHHARDRVHPRQAARNVDGRAEQRDPGQERAHAGKAGDAQRQEFAVPVEGKLGVPVRIARLVVGDEGLGAGRYPMNWAAYQPRGAEQRHIFRIARRLHAEPAADIVGQHANPIRRKPQCAAELTAHAGDALGAAAQGEAGRLVVARRQGARLHRDRGDPLVDEVPASDMVGAGEDAVDLAPIVARRIGRRGPVEGEIAGGRGPDLGAGGGAPGVHDRRQRIIIDRHAVGRIERGGRGFGNDQRHRLADMEDAFDGERRTERRDRLHAVAPRQRHRSGHGAEIGCGKIARGDHRHHAGHGQRRGAVDGPDDGMGMGRTHENACRRAVREDVVGVAAAAPQQGIVFDAPGPAVPILVPRRRVLEHARGTPLAQTGITRRIISVESAILHTA